VCPDERVVAGRALPGADEPARLEPSALQVGRDRLDVCRLDADRVGAEGDPAFEDREDDLGLCRVEEEGRIERPLCDACEEGAHVIASG
jgi:hypothetical protein